MSENLIKYEAILRNYHNGVYGKEHLTLHEILQRANAENLLTELTKDDLEYLLSKSSGINKMIYANLFHNAK